MTFVIIIKILIIMIVNRSKNNVYLYWNYFREITHTTPGNRINKLQIKFIFEMVKALKTPAHLKYCTNL